MDRLYCNVLPGSIEPDVGRTDAPVADQVGEGVGRAGGKVPDRTFPHAEDPPALRLQFSEVAYVAQAICFELGNPEIRPRCRNLEIPATRMPMPEATVNHYHRIPSREHEIRSAGQSGNMDAVAQPLLPECGSELPFRSRILAADAGHHPGASRRVDDINHGLQASIELGAIQ